MGAEPSIAARTAIELGIENRDPTTGDLLIRTANLEQIPIYNAFNPVQPRNRRTALNRAKTGLASDGFAMGASSYGLQGEFYIYGDGIANLPPSYFQIIRACGFKEIRLASIPASSATPASAESATGGAMGPMAAGGYGYAYTVLFEEDGTTPAASLEVAAFESRMSTKFVDGTPITTGVSTGSAAITALPSAGIKRLYRTKSAGGALTHPASYQFVAMIADGVTSYTDTLADANLGQRAPFRGDVDAGSLAGTPDTGGALDDGAVYQYRLSVLYDADGALIVPASGETLAQAADRAAYEAVILDYDGGGATELEVDLDPGDQEVNLDLTGVAAGVRRLYRTVGGGTDFFFVTLLAHDATAHTDQLADASLGHAMRAYSDHAIYLPVSQYADFDALTALSYLDSRKYPAKSCRGGFEMNGDAGENMLARFTIEGAYSQSTKVANPTLASNPGDPPQLCASDLVIAPQGGAEREVDWLSLGLSVPRTPGARRSGNAPCANAGVREYQINQPVDPRLTIVIEAPKEIGLGTDTDWIHEDRTAVRYGFRFHVGNDARSQVTFTNDTPWGERRYLGQIAEDPSFDTDQETGNRTMRINIQLTERSGIDNSFVRCEYGRV